MRIARYGIERWEYGDEFGSGEEEDIKLKRKMRPDEIEEGIQILREFASEARYEQICSVAKGRTKNFVVGYERPSNPNNFFACLRTIDSFGIQNVAYVADSQDFATARAKRRRSRAISFENRKLKMKSALGSQKWLTIHEFVDTLDMLNNLKAKGYQIIATDLQPGAQPITELHSPEVHASRDNKIALIFGNEEAGISEQLRQLCDLRVFIPMRGFAESFNLSVATAAILSRLDALNFIPPQQLSIQEQNQLIFLWLSRSIGYKSTSAILRRYHSSYSSLL
uniref:tRNA/rRNA methyltransferase SpoU type domain-containing protein n=1 Tax=Aureoumbra lagunensis TaxID=44058 RepID=A0A7S3NR72_9STRA